MTFKDQVKNSLLNDRSLWLLLLSNFQTIFFAIKDGWNPVTIMWVYWFQSVIIGIFSFIKLLQLKETGGTKNQEDNLSRILDRGLGFFMAFFFLFHYGFFHFVYAMFLSSGIFTNEVGTISMPAEFNYILLSAFIFLINHLFSYFYNRKKDVEKQSLETLMTFPYLRIIPMHFTIIFGSILGGALPIFLILKTLADGVMHIKEHASDTQNNSVNYQL
ncbi:MAG: DUF6498-containing protein [bacterium]